MRSAENPPKAKMKQMSTPGLTQVAEKYASDFVRELQIGNEMEQKCEWTCLLWSKDYWAAETHRTQIRLQQTKDHSTSSRENSKTLQSLFFNSQFLNTAAQVYSMLFQSDEQTCPVKKFAQCPFMGQRQDLLIRGSLASVFITILHKATLYAMLDRHPLDSGLMDEEYTDVYGIDLTNYRDLEESLTDGRFDRLFKSVVKKATELAGLKPKESQV